MMGSRKNEEGRRDDEGPQHRVTIQSFWIGKYPITQRQWQAILLILEAIIVMHLTNQLIHVIGCTQYSIQLSHQVKW